MYFPLQLPQRKSTAHKAIPSEIHRTQNSLGHQHVPRLAGELFLEQGSDFAPRLLQALQHGSSSIAMFPCLHKPHHMLQLTLLHTQQGHHTTLSQHHQLLPPHFQLLPPPPPHHLWIGLLVKTVTDCHWSVSSAQVRKQAVIHCNCAVNSGLGRKQAVIHCHCAVSSGQGRKEVVIHSHCAISSGQARK